MLDWIAPKESKFRLTFYPVLLCLLSCIFQRAWKAVHQTPSSEMRHNKQKFESWDDVEKTKSKTKNVGTF